MKTATSLRSFAASRPRLSPSYRHKTIRACYRLGLSQSQIADVLGCSRNTAHVACKRLGLKFKMGRPPSLLSPPSR